MIANSTHIVFNGGGTIVDDENIQKLRKYQKQVVYQKQLLAQMEENRQKKLRQKLLDQEQEARERIELDRAWGNEQEKKKSEQRRIEAMIQQGQPPLPKSVVFQAQSPRSVGKAAKQRSQRKSALHQTRSSTQAQEQP